MNDQDFKQLLQEELKNVATKNDVREMVREETKDLKTDVKDLKQGQKDHEKIFTAIKKGLSKLDGIDKTTKEILELEKKGEEERRALKGRIGIVEEEIKELKENKGVVYQSID